MSSGLSPWQYVSSRDDIHANPKGKNINPQQEAYMKKQPIKWLICNNAENCVQRGCAHIMPHIQYHNCTAECRFGSEFHCVETDQVGDTCPFCSGPMQISRMSMQYHCTECGLSLPRLPRGSQYMQDYSRQLLGFGRGRNIRG